MSKLLILGARKGSLGEAVANTARRAGWHAVTAGIAGEDYWCDVRNSGQIVNVLENTEPEHVLVTVGINKPNTSTRSVAWLTEHFNVNCVSVMNVLEAWQSTHSNGNGHHFVAISSNSAHIARRNSMAYCASKAALSMALRVAAREMAGKPFIVYGWELGLLADTPMSAATAERFGAVQTRIPGAENGLLRYDVARHVFSTLRNGGIEVNGCMMRLDGGEQ